LVLAPSAFAPAIASAPHCTLAPHLPSSGAPGSAHHHSCPLGHLEDGDGVGDELLLPLHRSRVSPHQ
jgi:hypothetical protein